MRSFTNNAGCFVNMVFRALKKKVLAFANRYLIPRIVPHYKKVAPLLNAWLFLLLNDLPEVPCRGKVMLITLIESRDQWPGKGALG